MWSATWSSVAEYGFPFVPTDVRPTLPLPKTSSGLVGAGVPHVGRPSAGCWLWALRSWVIDAAGWFAVLLRLAYLGVTNAFAVLRLLPMSNRDKDVEILALRHQITVLERHLGKERVRFDTSPADSVSRVATRS